MLKKALLFGLLLFVCVSSSTYAAFTLLPFQREWSASQISTYITFGADVNATEDIGITPLMRAAEYCVAPEVVATLIKAGAKVNASDANGTTPLMYAAISNAHRHWLAN